MHSLKQLLIASICLLPIGTLAQTAAGFAQLNAKAEQQYLHPIRPGQEGKAPFWNAFAHRFIYAPAFPFQKVAGARKYRFELTTESGAQFSFTHKNPQACIAPEVWQKLPEGKVTLTLSALNAKGQPIGESQTRSFTRDYPFHSPYPEAPYSYREAAERGLLYVHRMPQIQHWRTSTEPDMSYSYHTYPCKIIGATIRCECMLARLRPEYRQEALETARGAAAFLMKESRPEGSPLAYFPPTYYNKGGGKHATNFKENQNKTMMLEAIIVGDAMLDLYEATHEQQYLDHALGIAATYQRMQKADGSQPIKVDYLTGEPVNQVSAMLGHYLRFVQRLHRDFGHTEYLKAEALGDRWMKQGPMKTFDLTGQFEDVSVQGLKPYENLTNVTACIYATYLTYKPRPTRRELRDAYDLISMSEDQFVHWRPVGKDYPTPSVFEQHKFQQPINSSTANVAEALIGYWSHTGDELAYQKAKALMDCIVRTQDEATGYLPTSLRGLKNYGYHWVNCTYNTAEILLLMEQTQLSHDKQK